MTIETSTVTRMQALVSRWEKSGKRKAVFLNCYLMMTRNMLTALEAGEFRDPDWVGELLERFAEYYFEALEAYERDPELAPRVWQAAHEMTNDPQALALQHLLLGVNAHINYDLVLTLVEMLRPEWNTLEAERRAARFGDYCHVNMIIARTIDSVQDQVLEPAMPMLDWMDRLMGPVDEFLISRLLTRWRETVWRNAVRMLEADAEEERGAILAHVEREALEIGGVICLGYSLDQNS